MLQSKSRSWIEVDLQTVRKNYRILNEHVGNTKIMAVVKANAYGHGDIQVAKALQEEGVDFFAVSSIDEAVRLREHGFKENILILGYTPNEHFHYLIEHDIVQCIMSKAYALQLSAYAKSQNKSIRGHIKVDTGMGRLGFPVLENDDHIEEVIETYHMENLKVEGIFSHFSVADTYFDKSDHEFTALQIKRYDRVLDVLKSRGITYGVTHIQNSYGVLNYPELPYDYCRPGIILVGSTSDDEIALKAPVGISPSLTWKANVSLVKEVKKGNYVSYGRNFQAQHDMKVATVSTGYADGMHRAASHHHFNVLVHGEFCEVIGNICMDQFLIDVSHIKDVNDGDVVTLVGKDGNNQVYIDQLSRAANTINNESFCLLSYRVPRFYIGE